MSIALSEGPKKTQQLNFSSANLDGRPSAYTSLVPCSSPPPCTRGQAASMPPHQFLFRLRDRAARSPFHCGMEHVGVRAPMPRGVCDSLRLAHWPLLDSNRMGAHTAMCAGRVLVLLSIITISTIITIYISHGGCRNVYASGGSCVFSAPYSRRIRETRVDGLILQWKSQGQRFLFNLLGRKLRLLLWSPVDLNS